jgi:hypothetical protein
MSDAVTVPEPLRSPATRPREAETLRFVLFTLLSVTVIRLRLATS